MSKGGLPASQNKDSGQTAGSVDLPLSSAVRDRARAVESLSTLADAEFDALAVASPTINDDAQTVHLPPSSSVTNRYRSGDGSDPAVATAAVAEAKFRDALTRAQTEADLRSPLADPATRVDPDPHAEIALSDRIRQHLDANDGARPDDVVGSVIDGRYLVGKRLGAGGMGAVYRARQTDLGRDVAIKVLLDELSPNDTLTRRFTVEALAVSRLKHPNTIQIYDFGKTAAGRLYIVMELLEGETLNDRILGLGRLPVRMALRILAHIAAALDEAHGKGIIHRDLKPENIFLVKVGDDPDFVKVLDFGVAKLRDGAGDGKGTLTKAGSIFGTPRYMSPEQASARAVDARSDLYSLGIMLFEMLTGRPPFEAEQPLLLLLAHVNQTAPMIAEVAPDLAVPRDVERLLMELIDKQPNRRPATAAVLRDRCLELLDILPDIYEREVARSEAASLGYAVADAPTIVTSADDSQLMTATPTISVDAAMPAHAERSKRKGSAVIVGAVAAAALLVGGILALNRRDDAQQADVAAHQTAAQLLEMQRLQAEAVVAPDTAASAAATVGVELISDPPGAAVIVHEANGPVAAGITPLTLSRKRGDAVEVVIQLAGYGEKRIKLGFDRDGRERLSLRPTAAPVAPTAVVDPPDAPVSSATPKRPPRPKPAKAEATKAEPTPPVKKPGNPAVINDLM